jgi:hypothetical protein
MSLPRQVPVVLSSSPPPVDELAPGVWDRLLDELIDELLAGRGPEGELIGPGECR